MKPQIYCLIGGTIFSIVAIAHWTRVVLNVPLQIGAWELPMWFSLGGGVATVALCLLRFLSARRG